jgi:hypothetical protein
VNLDGEVAEALLLVPSFVEGVGLAHAKGGTDSFTPIGTAG